MRPSESDQKVMLVIWIVIIALVACGLGQMVTASTYGRPNPTAMGAAAFALAVAAAGALRTIWKLGRSA